jgi:hypothetical protein
MPTGVNDKSEILEYQYVHSSAKQHTPNGYLEHRDQLFNGCLALIAMGSFVVWGSLI